MNNDDKMLVRMNATGTKDWERNGTRHAIEAWLRGAYKGVGVTVLAYGAWLWVGMLDEAFGSRGAILWALAVGVAVAGLAGVLEYRVSHQP